MYIEYVKSTNHFFITLRRCSTEFVHNQNEKKIPMEQDNHYLQAFDGFYRIM